MVEKEKVFMRSVKRLVKRCTEEVYASFRIASKTSISDAITVLRAKKDIQVLAQNGYKETPVITRHLLKKHQIMNEYFEKTIHDVSKFSCRIKQDTDGSLYKDCIWICWWQGLDQAPVIVKKCVESVRKHAGSHPVIILTDQNVKDYIELPSWIVEKYAKGTISKTHLSDILRLALLAEYGGMWLDATFFCTSDRLQDYFEMPVWTIKRPDYAHASVACGQFANFSWACDREHQWIFQLMRDYLLEYWKENDMLIDYLVLDYLIILIQKNNEEFKAAFHRIPANNANCDELLKCMEEEYSQDRMKRLEQDTCLFKLTWKQNFKRQLNGKPTFYGYIVKN